MDLSGKVALVTGGGNGIGAATARALAAAGARVVVADIDRAAAVAVAAEVGGRAVALDVTSEAGWDTAVADILATEGRLDVAHLNAGVMTRPRGARFDDDVLPWLTADTYRRLMGVNVEGVVLGTLACARAMAGGGDIVATASIAAMVAMGTDPYYTLSKAAVASWVRSMGPVLAPRGVRISAVCPGGIDTGIVPANLREARPEAFSPPSYIADAVLHAIEAAEPGTVWIAYSQDQAPWAYEWPPIHDGGPEHER